MNRWIVSGVFVAGAVCLAGGAQAASFDCKKAQSAIEKIICGDADLNSYDQQLAAAYAGALDRSNDPEKIRVEQRAWIRTRDACADARCMTPLFVKRIDALSKVDDPPAGCPGETTPDIDACRGKYSARADRELDLYLAAARKQIGELASEPGAGDMVKGTLADFNQAQTAWAPIARPSAAPSTTNGATVRSAASCTTTVIFASPRPARSRSGRPGCTSWTAPRR